MRLLSGALALVTLSAIAHAAPTKDPKLAHQKLVSAQEAVRRGDADAARGHAGEAKTQWTNAIADFEQALDAGEDLAVNVELAGVEEKLGHLADAYKHLQLVVHADGVKPDVLKKVQAKLDDISSRIGTVKLEVTPDSAQVSVGGNVVATSPGQPLVLTPGNYTISLSAPGYQPKDIELKVLAGGEVERKLALDPIPVVVTKHVDEAPPAPPPAPKFDYVPLIIGGSVTFAFAVTATITGISAIHQHDTFVDPNTDPTDRGHAQSAGRLDAHLTDTFIGGAVLAAVATGGWYYYTLVYKHESPSKVAVAPWVESNASGLAVAGSF
jgi:hypothetical protein